MTCAFTSSEIMSKAILFHQNIKAVLLLCKIVGLSSIVSNHQLNNRHPYYFEIKLSAFTNIFFVLIRLCVNVCGAIEILLDLRKTTISFAAPILEKCIAILSNILSTVVCIQTDKLLIDAIVRLKFNSYRHRCALQPLSSQSPFRSSRHNRYIWIGICVVAVCAYLSGNFITSTDIDTRHSRINSTNIPVANNRTTTLLPAPVSSSSPSIRVRFLTLCLIYEKLTYILTAILFFTFADEIREQLDYFNEEIRELRERVHSTGTRKSDGATATGIGLLIEHYRCRYEYLVLITEKINLSVGSRLLVPLILMPMRICIQFYKFVHYGRLGYLKLRLISSATLYSLTYFLIIYVIALSGSLISQTSYAVFQSLNSISVARLRPELQLMVKIFQEHMSIRPVIMTAAGFIRIEKKIITSIFLSITTYCMVILQLRHSRE